MASQLKETIGRNQIKLSVDNRCLRLKWCGFAFNFFKKPHGKGKYYPLEAKALPENRLFAENHAPQTTAMKDQILTELALPASKVRITFATVALGMGGGIPSIRCIIHVGPPSMIREYLQETRRAGQDRKPANAILHYNNHNIANNQEGMSEDIRTSVT